MHVLQTCKVQTNPPFMRLHIESNGIIHSFIQHNAFYAKFTNQILQEFEKLLNTKDVDKYEVR